ncbi:PqqD family peptide modification chaperone [Enterococcus faecium]|uniref:PqqD family peptide modification chaperone n=1 Tax=Enterococcus lactis TaxID=357441 RepID=UPI00384565DC|nr:PqqD family peptide modification chaperone [Enterococcus faecium]
MINEKIRNVIFFNDNTIFSFDIFIHPEIYIENQRIFDKRIPELEMIVDSIGLLICNKLIETKKISLKELFQWFQEEFPDVPKENLKKDLVVFLQALNNRGIINYTLPKRTSIKEKISCSIKKIQKNLRTSHSIHNEKTLKIFLEVCFHVLKENFPIITFVCGVNLLCLLFLFLSFQEIRLEFLWILFPAFSYLVLLMSIILHETTHLILYRKITHHNHGYLSIKTLSMSIVREKVLDRKSNILITFSGAIFVFFLGVLLYFLSDNLWIRIPAFIFMFHIINLLPFFGDGHTIITELLNSND